MKGNSGGASGQDSAPSCWRLWVGAAPPGSGVLCEGSLARLWRARAAPATCSVSPKSRESPLPGAPRRVPPCVRQRGSLVGLGGRRARDELRRHGRRRGATRGPRLPSRASGRRHPRSPVLKTSRVSEVPRCLLEGDRAAPGCRHRGLHCALTRIRARPRVFRHVTSESHRFGISR